MQSVQEIARDIVAREGGYVNDPDDPGGATNHGVTIHTMRALDLDLDGDGAVDIPDVKALTRDQAVEIFIKHYFYEPRIDRLPEAMQATVFDMQVNAGSNAVRLLQDVLTEAGFGPLARDGAIGPKTEAACAAAHARMGTLLVDAYGIERRNYYSRIGDRRSASRKYARRRDGGKGGWILRAELFIDPRFHLSEVEHAARVAGWT
ncbi:MAG: holin-associated N-acetylmuramidase [Pseudomonadota bacterium]